MARVGATHLESSLSQGKALSRLVLKSIHLANGKVFAFLPPAATNQAIRHTNTGGLVKATDSEDAAVLTVVNYLRQLKSAIFISEHALARCTDPHITGKPAKWFCYEDQVYYWIADSSVNADGVHQVLRNGRSWLNTGFVCSVGSLSEAEAGLANPTPKLLADLAQGVVLILVSAYDGEGYIFWQKR